MIETLLTYESHSGQLPLWCSPRASPPAPSQALLFQPQPPRHDLCNILRHLPILIHNGHAQEWFLPQDAQQQQGRHAASSPIRPLQGSSSILHPRTRRARLEASSQGDHQQRRPWICMDASYRTEPGSAHPKIDSELWIESTRDLCCCSC